MNPAFDQEINQDIEPRNVELIAIITKRGREIGVHASEFIHHLAPTQNDSGFQKPGDTLSSSPPGLNNLRS
jgi:hypothetical protein